MKRLHVHVSVKDVAASIRFYRELLVAEPAAMSLRQRLRSRAARRIARPEVS